MNKNRKAKKGSTKKDENVQENFLLDLKTFTIFIIVTVYKPFTTNGVPAKLIHCLKKRLISFYTPPYSLSKVLEKLGIS